MFTRRTGGFVCGLVVALLGASALSAQPGAGPGPDLKRLEADLNKLRAQVQEAETNLQQAMDAANRKGPGPGGFGGFPGGPGGPFGGKKGKGDFKGSPGFEKKGGPGEGKGPGFEKKADPKNKNKMDPDSIKEKYEFYKKLYDESKREKAKPAGPAFGRGFGGWRGAFPGKGPDAPARSIEARIDRLILELEELRYELKKK